MVPVRRQSILKRFPLIFNSTINNKLKWNANQTPDIFGEGKSVENVICNVSGRIMRQIAVRHTWNHHRNQQAHDLPMSCNDMIKLWDTSIVMPFMTNKATRHNNAVFVLVRFICILSFHLI